MEYGYSSMGIMGLISLTIPTITVSCPDDTWVPIVFIFFFFPILIAFMIIYPLLQCTNRNAELATAFKEVNNKQALFVLWSIFYTLVPLIPAFKFEMTKDNAKYYILLVGIFVFIYIIDEFLHYLFFGMKIKYQKMKKTIDVLSIIISTFALWGCGVTISTLLFDNMKSIIIFD